MEPINNYCGQPKANPPQTVFVNKDAYWDGDTLVWNTDNILGKHEHQLLFLEISNDVKELIMTLIKEGQGITLRLG